MLFESANRNRRYFSESVESFCIAGRLRPRNHRFCGVNLKRNELTSNAVIMSVGATTTGKGRLISEFLVNGINDSRTHGNCFELLGVTHDFLTNCTQHKECLPVGRKCRTRFHHIRRIWV